jgi:hypothetical protein
MFWLGTPVPKTAINKNGNVFFWKDEIWLSE